MLAIAPHIASGIFEVHTFLKYATGYFQRAHIRACARACTYGPKRGRQEGLRTQTEPHRAQRARAAGNAKSVNAAAVYTQAALCRGVQAATSISHKAALVRRAILDEAGHHHLSVARGPEHEAHPVKILRLLHRRFGQQHGALHA